jgi:transposase
VSVSREHWRAKTDRLDVGLLKRSYLGWLRGEKKHCSMVAVPSHEEEDGKRPLRERERERLVGQAIRLVNRLKGLLALHGIARFNPRSAPTRLGRARSRAAARLRSAAASARPRRCAAHPTGRRHP